MEFLRNVLNAIIGLLRNTDVQIGFAISTSATGYKRMATYFTDAEVEGLDKELVSKLDTARKVAGIPFRITSGKRTCSANTAAMGVEGSSHLAGLAVDLAVDSGADRYLIVKGLLAAGFNRIGIYNKHCHCDIDGSKPPNVVWWGESH